MQIAPIISPVSVPVATATAQVTPFERPPRPGHGPDSVVRPAAPGLPAALEGAVDGVARLGTSAPIVDFPGISAGDVFDIIKGSKAGLIGVRGTAEILRFDPDFASFHIDAGRFGVSVDVVVDIEQVGADQVRISARGKGIPDTTELGRVIEQRTNYAVFEQVSDPTKRTVIAHDGRGGITIDTVVPTFGNAHLVMQRR